MLSCHLLLGRPLDLFPLLGCYSVQHLVRLVSLILALCLAHLHLCFSVYSIMSIIFVLFLISEHGILSCSFRFNIFLFIALWAVFSLFVNCLLRDHVWQSLLARHIGPLLIFWVKWGVVYLGVFPWVFFSKTAPGCSDPGIYFFCSVFEVCDLSEVFEFCHFFFWLFGISALSAWFVRYFVFPLCIFRPTYRLSEVRLFKCFPLCFVFVVKKSNIFSGP